MVENFSCTNFKTPTQINTPIVLSRTLVVKYQKQASLSKWTESRRDIPIFIKWAISWETPCLDVSNAQIFQGLFGY